MLGTFSPQLESYTYETLEEITPSGLFVRGSYIFCKNEGIIYFLAYKSLEVQCLMTLIKSLLLISFSLLMMTTSATWRSTIASTSQENGHPLIENELFSFWQVIAFVYPLEKNLNSYETSLNF